MKLSDFKGEEALDVLADIIEPLTTIIADKEIQELAKVKGTPKIKFVKPAIKNHKEEVIYILATLQRQTPEEYEANLSLVTLPMQVLEFINDPEIQKLFFSQAQSQSTSQDNSGSAMENTKEKEN